MVIPNPVQYTVFGEDTLNRVDDLWDSGKGMDFYFFNPTTISTLLEKAGFKITGIRYREPDTAIEYNSQRAYVFAVKL